MKVKVTKSYLWAQDGNHVRTVEVGEVLEGEGAQVALDMRAGEVLPEAGAAAGEGAPEAAPPAPRAPKGKGR